MNDALEAARRELREAMAAARRTLAEVRDAGRPGIDPAGAAGEDIGDDA